MDKLRLTVERLGPEPDDDDDLDEPEGDAEDAWDTFVDAHPELSKPTTFTDEELLDALRVAIETEPQPWSRGAVPSSCVASVLLPHERGSKTSLVRVGKALARLAREGQVVRFRQKWTRGRGSSIWSFQGFEIGEYWLKGYEVDDAR